MLLVEGAGFSRRSHGHFDCRRYTSLHIWNETRRQDDTPDCPRLLLDRVPHALAIVQLQHLPSTDLILLCILPVTPTIQFSAS